MSVRGWCHPLNVVRVTKPVNLGNLEKVLPMPRAIVSLILLSLLPSLAYAQKPVLFLSDEKGELPVLTGLLSDEGYAVSEATQEGALPELARFDAVVVYIHKPLTEPVETALIDYAKKGGRLLVLHHAIASAKMRNPRWLKFLGIALFPRNDVEHPWSVSAEVTHTMVNLAPKHWITTHKVKYDRTVDYQSKTRPEYRGRFGAFDLPNTEIFHNQRFIDGDAKTILFGYLLEGDTAAQLPANVPSCEETSGWFKQTGTGLVFYLQAGHAAHDFENPNFKRVILNCLEWEKGRSQQAEGRSKE